MLVKEVIAVYSEKSKKSAKIAALLIMKASGIFISRQALKG
jgi:hypothetical protein